MALDIKLQETKVLMAHPTRVLRVNSQVHMLVKLTMVLNRYSHT